MKTALITGVTGQDGAYLAEFLLNRGYTVHGIKRRTSLFNTERIDHLYQNPWDVNVKFKLHFGDVTDFSSIMRLIKEIEPDEIYNLAAMSHVKVSFEMPYHTAEVNGLGVLNILESVRILNLSKEVKIYQASTSELFGNCNVSPQNEATRFYPRSPYGVSKLFAHWSVINYREAYQMYAVNGILFNHESPKRGETFLTRKITRAATAIFLGLQDKVYLGNLDSVRDWGHAKDYVRAMWLMLQQKSPQDYVIATGQAFSIRDFLYKVFLYLGVEIEFVGTQLKEKGVVKKLNVDNTHLSEGDIILEVNPKYERPTEVNSLKGDSSKARIELGWEPEYNIDKLIAEMVEADLKFHQQH